MIKVFFFRTGVCVLLLNALHVGLALPSVFLRKKGITGKETKKHPA